MSARGAAEVVQVPPRPVCWRETDAVRLNEILRSPDLKPFLGDFDVEPEVLSAVVQNQRNFNLMGEHGGCLFIATAAAGGSYEVHTHMLKSGRGAHAFAFARAALAWMFTRTDCFEVTTRIPKPHDGARMLAVKSGMRHEFTRDGPCKFEGKDVPVDIYSIRVQDWAPKCGEFDDKAVRFCKLAKIATDDANYNRYLGISLEMVGRGQILKGIQFLNRWAVAARRMRALVIGVKPTMMKLDFGTVVFRDEDEFEVIP